MKNTDLHDTCIVHPGTGIAVFSFEIMELSTTLLTVVKVVKRPAMYSTIHLSIGTFMPVFELQTEDVHKHSQYVGAMPRYGRLIGCIGCPVDNQDNQLTCHTLEVYPKLYMVCRTNRRGRTKYRVIRVAISVYGN